MKYLLILLLTLSLQSKQKESFYQKKWAKTLNNAKLEVVLKDRSRVDILTDTHAIEVDFAYSWAEAVGQSLHYSALTGKKAGILLIITKPNDMRHFKRLINLIKHHKLNIDVWLITDYETKKQGK